MAQVPKLFRYAVINFKCIGNTCLIQRWSNWTCVKLVSTIIFTVEGQRKIYYSDKTLVTMTKNMDIYFLFWLNLPVGSNLIRKFNELQYQKNFSEEKNQKLFENSCISFPYQLKIRMEQALFFLNLNYTFE